jgi:hypothetical protein
VHRPETAWPVKLLKRGDLGYWHCRAITTNWKHFDRLAATPGPEDPETAAALARVFR